MKINKEYVFIIILSFVVFILPNFTYLESFDVFNHKLYYPDVDCLLTKKNSCIIKPNNDSFYNYNNVCCKQQTFLGDKYYEKVNSTCLDCKSKGKLNNVLEDFDGRAYYNRNNKSFYKTNSPGLYKKSELIKCNTNHIEKNNKCQQITY